MKQVEGFNRRFNELVKSLPQDIKPPEKAILIFYIQAFEGEMRYQLRDKEPTNVREAQDKAIKIDKNMRDSGKSNVLGFSREIKKVQNQEPQGDSIKELARLIKQMNEVYSNQLSVMHNKIVAMEKNKSNNHEPNDRWQKGIPKGPPYQEQERPPEPMEASNWFDDPVIPYCRACDDSHEEGTCPIFFQIIKEKLAARERMEHVNMAGHECVFDNNEGLVGINRR